MKTCQCNCYCVIHCQNCGRVNTSKTYFHRCHSNQHEHNCVKCEKCCQTTNFENIPKAELSITCCSHCYTHTPCSCNCDNPNQHQ